MKNLNTMDTFRNGFKIERDGNEDSEEYEFLSKLMNDEDICYNIENDILDNIMNDAGATEQAVINDYMESNMK